MSERYEFASPEWLAAMHAAFATAAQYGVLAFNEDFTFSEVYTDVPAHIASANGTVAFTISVSDAGRSVAFEVGEADSPDLTLRGRWEDYLPLVRMMAGSEAESQREFQRAMTDAMRSGALRVDGDITRFAAGFDIHDTIARLTA